MKLVSKFVCGAAFCSLFIALNPALAQGTAFTFQGRLDDTGLCANGAFDFQFILYGQATGGSSIVTNTAPTLVVPVTNGWFTVLLDFGSNPNPFTGSARWLQMGLRTNGSSGAYSLLNARQQLTPTPYAIYSENAGQATNVTSGAITPAQLATLGPPGAGQVLSYNGSSLVWTNPGAMSGGWNLSGNSGSTNGNFLGTTDNQPLELRVNSSRAFRLEPTANDGTHSGLVNVVGGSSSNAVSAGVYGGTISGGGGRYPGSSPALNRVTADLGTVGGGNGNTAGGLLATVAGGYQNTSGDRSTVGGGVGNVSTNSFTTVAGGLQNTSGGIGATVGGGTQNRSSGQGATVAGGGYDGLNFKGNVASGNASTVGGGNANAAAGNYATVGGGYVNTNSGDYATVGGGRQNTSSGPGSTVAGGGYDGVNTIGNVASGTASTVGGGIGNQSTAQDTTVAGGAGNLATSDYATVGGGFENHGYGYNATVSGGANNTANGGWSTVGGGYWNAASGQMPVLSGGYYNTNSGDYATLGGGQNNYIPAGATHGTIGGGANNSVGDQTSSGNAATVSGGVGNTAGGSFSVVCGGTLNGAPNNGSFVGGGGTDGSTFAGNNAMGVASAIVGGLGNTISGGGLAATIGGGRFNTNSGFGATVAGGEQNNASGNDAVVCGGINNTASGNWAIVAGGSYNIASQPDCFAAGYQAHAIHQGAFVWADSQSASFASTGNNQFLIRAAGGVGIGTTGPLHPLTVGVPETPVNGSSLLGLYNAGGTYLTTRDTTHHAEGLLGSDAAGVIFGAMTDHALSFRAGNSAGSGNVEYMRVNRGGNVGIGTASPSYQLQLSTDSAGKPNGGSWANSSDARLKRNVQPLASALDKLMRLRGVTFEWMNPEDHANQTNVQGGFIAQEVAAAFPSWVTEVPGAEHDKRLTPDGKVKSLSLPFEFDALVVEALRELRAEKQTLAQGVNQRLEEELKRRDAEDTELMKSMAEAQKSLEQKATEITELKSRVAHMEDRFSALQKAVARLAPTSSTTLAVNRQAIERN